MQKTVEALEHIVTTFPRLSLDDRVAILVDGGLYNPDFEEKLTAAIAPGGAFSRLETTVPSS